MVITWRKTSRKVGQKKEENKETKEKGNEEKNYKHDVNFNTFKHLIYFLPLNQVSKIAKSFRAS